MATVQRTSSSPRGEPPPPYQPPSQGDRLFYLLLTVTASTVVYKSFPKSLRGIATIGVASFGIYHAFGMNCDCIKHVFARIFGNFPGGSGSDSSSMKDWGCFTRLPWETTPRRPFSSHTGGVDHTQRQGKRPRNPHEEWKGERSESPPPLSPFSTPPHNTSGRGRGSHGLPTSFSFPSAVAVDTRERQGKRTGEQEEKRRSPSPEHHGSTSVLSPFSSTGAVDTRKRQQKRSGQTGSDQQYW